MELKCGTKIKWYESPYSLTTKEGIIVNVYSVRKPDDKQIYRYIKFSAYDVIEAGTGFLYNVRDTAITCVNVGGKWISYSNLSSGYPRSSGGYPWTLVDEKAAHGYVYSFKPKQVIFNGPATIVLWKDGTKTIVKRREGEPDDKEKAIMYCILKKLCGGKAPMDKYLKLFLKEEESNEEKKD